MLNCVYDFENMMTTLEMQAKAKTLFSSNAKQSLLHCQSANNDVASKAKGNQNKT